MENSTPRELPPIATRWRFVKAYSTTFRVIGSYLWLQMLARFRSPNYIDERLNKAHALNAERIQDAILRLQGLFIKVGQLISILTNFLPEEFRSGLAGLQDAVPGRPFDQIEQRIREELGAAPREIFSTFDETPVASASLGQVHTATTQDGRQVAVKVQHLGIEAMSVADLKTIRRILGIISIFFKIRGLDNFYHEIRAMILAELDFELEARNIETIARNFSDNADVIFPRPIFELSTSRVLTLDYVDGIKVSNRAQLIAAGIEPKVVARDLVVAYCQMIFVDGIYHADPHPGNILIQPDGKIVFLDFGAVGQLSKGMREGISSFIEAIIKADETQLLDSLKKMGFIAVGASQAESAAKVIEHFHRRFQEEIRLENFSLSSIQIDTKKGLESLADLRRLDLGIREISSAFHVPKEWVLLERSALLLTGLCTHLDPEMNPTEIIQPYLEEFVLGKDRDWAEMIFDLGREKLLSFLSLPGQIEKAVAHTLDGKVPFNVPGIASSAQLLYAAGHQLIYTALACVSAGMGLYFHDHGQLLWAERASWAAATSLGLLFLSMLRSLRVRKKLLRETQKRF